MAIKEVEKEGMEKAKRFAVRLDPQHPGGVYHRAGMTFVVKQDVYLDMVPEAIMNDPWLMVAELKGDAPPVFNTLERRAKQPERRL